MRRVLLGFIILAGCLALYSCATDQGYNTQKGAAIGAVGGALAGQAIGHNTASTLIGAGSGALVGALAGNAIDQSNAQRRLAQQQPPPPVYAPPPQPANPGPEAAPVPPPPVYAPPAPPDVVLIPGTYAYFVPGIEAEIIFYHGFWYRHFRGYWYGAPHYGGPWAFVPGPRVPHVLLTLPPGWHRVPPGYRPIPHAELHKNWERWERERHWEHHH